MNEYLIDFANMTPELSIEFNKIAENERKNYTRFIDTITEQYKNEYFWWITPLVSRDSTLCDAFYDYCIIKLALQILNEKQYKEICVPKKSIKKAIERNGHKDIKIIVRENKKNVIKRTIYGAYAKKSFNTLKKRIDTVKKACSNEKVFLPSDETVLVDKYVIPSQFKNGVYTDRYFKGLRENADRRIMYLTQLDFASYEEGKELAVNVSKLQDCIMFERFVEEEDYEAVLGYINFCKKIRYQSCVFEGIDYVDIINDALIVGTWNTTSMYAVLKGKALERLIVDHGLKVSMLLGWDEGQPSSNGMFQYIRKKFDFPTVGYVISPCQENTLCEYPSPLQVKEKCVPEYYAVQGSAWLASVKQFEPAVKCTIAPSFRYQYVYDIDYKEDIETRKGIVVVLPYDICACKYFLREFIAVWKKYPNLDIEIKNHPMNEKFRLSDYGISETESSGLKHTFITGNMIEVIKNKEMVILCGETTSYLEIILTGVCVVAFMIPGRLKCLCLPLSIDFDIQLAYKAEDLERYISEKRKKGLHKDKRLQIRDSCFTSVNKETVRRMLEVENYE